MLHVTVHTKLTVLTMLKARSDQNVLANLWAAYEKNIQYVVVRCHTLFILC